MSYRFRRRRTHLWLVAAALVGLIGFRLWQESRKAKPPEVLDAGPHRVAEVIDGDTLRLANHAVVQLMGVDAPGPGEPWASEAVEFTEAFVGDKPVELEFDRERIDRRGTYMAYVAVEGRELNEELLRAGLARVRLRPYYSDSKKRRFRKIESEARKAKRGLWSQY